MCVRHTMVFPLYPTERNSVWNLPSPMMLVGLNHSPGLQHVNPKQGTIIQAKGVGCCYYCTKVSDLSYRPQHSGSDSGELWKMLSSLRQGDNVSSCSICTTWSMVGRSSGIGAMHLAAMCNTASKCSWGIPSEHLLSTSSRC